MRVVVVIVVAVFVVDFTVKHKLRIDRQIGEQTNE